VVGGDYAEPILRIAQQHYKDKIPLVHLGAHDLPLKNQSFAVIILFGAIYHFKDFKICAKEGIRFLRPEGTLLICNANKDLPDFCPSPYSYRYFSAADFMDLLGPLGFTVQVFGDCPVNYDSPKQRILVWVKRTMVVAVNAKNYAGQEAAEAFSVREARAPAGGTDRGRFVPFPLSHQYPRNRYAS
jgi:SAM-dependent methyltransferase